MPNREVNIDHQDFLIASGAFTEEDEREYQEWLDAQRDEALMDQWWCERVEREAARRAEGDF